MAPAPNAAALEALTPGTILGRYEIGFPIGGGGVVRIYEAIHRGLERHVAVKVLAPLPPSQADARLRFFHEQEALSRVHHPNLVDIVEVVPDQPLGYVVMELLDGEELSEKIAREAPMSTEAAVDTLLPVVAALVAAHGAGTTHRALNPSNIFLTRVHDGSGAIQPKVLNLGISKISGVARTMALSDASDPAGINAASGYLAPEQVRDSRAADPRIDVYALGTILYECLTGRRAFDGENQFATLRIISSGACPAARSWRPDLPARLDAVISRAMSVDPAARFPSMNQLGEALVEFAGPAGTDLWRRPLALPAAHAAAQPAFPAAQPRAFQAPPQPHAFQAPPQAFQPPPQAFQPPKPTPAPFAPQAPAPEPTPLPAAKAGGTMMLTDELGNEIPMPQERGRRSAPRFTPRGGSRLSAPRGRRSTTGRRAPLAPAPRSSRFLAALAPAITLLFVAGAVVAVDRWGLDLWREHMPIVIPGSTADERPAREPPRPIEHPAAPAAPAPAPVAPAPHPAAPAPPPAAAAPARAERPEHVRKKKNRKGGHRRHYIHDAAALVPAEE